MGGWRADGSCGLCVLVQTTVIDLMPGVVGWVIGKGGQRIKEIMASSQCRMWVDQDVPPDEPRKLHLMVRETSPYVPSLRG